jgi:hypothetical protein
VKCSDCVGDSDESNASEAEDHHRPRRGFGHGRKYGHRHGSATERGFDVAIYNLPTASLRAAAAFVIAAIGKINESPYEYLAREADHGVVYPGR